MQEVMRVYLVVLLLLCLFWKESLITIVRAKSTIGYGQGIWLERAVDGLERAVAFYKTHYSEVNLDSIYGLRVAEGSIGRAISALSAHKVDKKTSVLHRIMEMHSGLHYIAKRSLKHLKSRNAKYFDKFKGVILEPWDYSMSFVSYDPNLVLPSKLFTKEPDQDFDEETSDFCMTALMGTHKEGNVSGCVITDKCWKKMITKGTFGYYLTHQALFFLLAEVAKCHDVIVQRAGGEKELGDLHKYFGSNIYGQAKELFQAGIKSDYKDLFMEQIVICSMLGIIQCYDIHWLELVLSWQDRSGCYKEPRFAEIEKVQIEKEEKGRTIVLSTRIIEVVDQNPILKEERSDNHLPSSNLPRRKLLEEIELTNGCLAHMTGIATGLLGTYVKWLVDPPPYEELGFNLPWAPKRRPKTSGPEPDLDFSTNYIILFVIFPLALLFFVCRRCSATSIFVRRKLMKWGW